MRAKARSAATPLPSNNSQRDSHPLLAREGWAHIALAMTAAVTVQFLFGWPWSVPLWVFAIFVLQFFRDPSRAIPTEAGITVCPADGKVVFVGAAQDPYLHRPALKLSIFMDVFSVHSNRIPAAGVVKELWYTPGRFINAELDKSSEHNERSALWIATDNGADVVCVQVAGLVARRILCYVQPGDRVQRGQRYGFIRFGSRLDIYLPPDVRPGVLLGDKVTAGTDVLARLEN